MEVHKCLWIILASGLDSSLHVRGSCQTGSSRDIISEGDALSVTLASLEFDILS